MAEDMHVEVDFKPRTDRALALISAADSYTTYENESFTSEQHSEEIAKRARVFHGFLQEG